MQAKRGAKQANLDRREGVRQLSVPRDLVVECGDHSRHQARLVDVSRSGVRICAQALFALGAEVVLFGPPDTGLAPLRARIVRRTEIRAAAQSSFDYGLAFADPLSDDRHAWFLTLRKAA